MSEQKHTRQFEVKKLFSVLTVRKKLTKRDLNDNNVYPAYSADSQNNGVIGYCEEAEFICNEKTPVYLIFGDHTRTFNIARRSFSALDNVKVLIPCVCSDEVLLYIIIAWQKIIPDLGYARHWKIARKCSISLPIQTNEEGSPIIDPEHKYHAEGYIPDWDYMQERIAELEQERIAELEQFLIASGLNDYELTEQEMLILNTSCKYERFSIPQIFSIRNSRNILKSDVVMGSGSFPYVTAAEGNNSIMGYVDYDRKMLEEGNCIFIGGKTTVFSYQATPFFSNDSHNLLLYCKAQEGRNEINSLYMIAQLKKALCKYEWSNSISYRKIQKEHIILPIQTNEEGTPIIDPECKYHTEGYIPDWDYMTAYIRAMKKVVIADVVKYKDEVIAKARSLVSVK